MIKKQTNWARVDEKEMKIFQIFTKSTLVLKFIIWTKLNVVGLGGLGVMCSPRDPKFGGLNTSEVDGFFFSGRKNHEHKSSGRDFKLGGPEYEYSGSLKNLKPEKIGLWAKFNRHIHVLVIPKFGGAQYIWKGRSALTTLSI